MGTATLGFAGGPAIAFRVDPDMIQWNWQVLTNVVETIGGRVIQVIGAYLEDLQVTGSLGQDHSIKNGESWRQAQHFLDLVTQIMEFQAKDATQQDKMHRPAVFTYPPRNWRFQVYVKALTDPDGENSVILTPAKANQRYTLTLFIVNDASESLVKAGTTGGVFSKKAYDAVSAFMARISAGVGWHYSEYNGVATGTLASDTGAKKKPAKAKASASGVRPAGNTRRPV